MGFQAHDLQEALFVPGTHDLRVWGYGKTNALEAVLRPDHPRCARPLVRPGHLIYVGTRPARDPVDGREIGELRAALVMVGGYESGDASLRLVQDVGRPEDGGRDAGGRRAGRWNSVRTRDGGGGRGGAGNGLGTGAGSARAPLRQPDEEKA